MALIPLSSGYGVWFKTGDHGRIVNGTIVYEGRSDSQVKIRGHRVDLTEVNHIVHQMKEVTSSVVLCYKAGEPEQVKALILKSKGRSLKKILVQPPKKSEKSEKSKDFFEDLKSVHFIWE